MINFSVAAAGEMVVGLRTIIDYDGAPGFVQFYDGTRPATGASSGSSTLVAALPLAYPCGTVNGTTGALEFASGGNGLVLASLTPTWARIRTNSGVFVADCNCRLIGATPDPSDPEEIVIDALGLTAGAYVIIAGGTISAPT